MDEPAQLITVETSLRMTWRDPRLTVRIPSYSPTNYVFFRSDVTKHIWFPDVYIDGKCNKVSVMFFKTFSLDIYSGGGIGTRNPMLSKSSEKWV